MAKFVFLGGDTRTLAAHAYLIENGYDALILTTEVNNRATMDDYLDIARSADVLILPSPLLSTGSFIRGTPNVELSDVLSVISHHTSVFAGSLPDLCKQQPINHVNYTYDEEYVCEMAYITAEGALGHILSNYNRVLRDACVVLTGWGRIAKRLYNMLLPFTENIRVILRREDEITRLKETGVYADNFIALDIVCTDADIIINTVPSLVLTRDIIKKLKPCVHLIDLASKPGGIDFKAADEAGIEAVHLLALPGKCAPVSAGIALGKCIINNIEKHGDSL